MTIDPSIKIAAEAAIDKLMAEVKGIKAVVVSTEDGFDVAARVENTAQVARLSAMASSLAALGAVAGEESQLGDCDHVTIGATNGHIIMLQARHPRIGLIVSLITGKEAIIGQAQYFARQAAQSLQQA
jgi:predicted regulator of Ras-like GTPase activity (Roadblock/LC7/MglB family)